MDELKPVVRQKIGYEQSFKNLKMSILDNFNPIKLRSIKKNHFFVWIHFAIRNLSTEYLIAEIQLVILDESEFKTLNKSFFRPLRTPMPWKGPDFL